MADAGWYPDPDAPGGLRYFDGQLWTEHREPAANQATAKPRNRTRLIVIGAVVAVALVAGLVTGGWWLFLRGGPSLTFQGHPIANPARVLSTAETNLKTVASGRHGVTANDSRCYFAVPKSPAAGAKKTDVDSELRCGPVLFVDGDASQSYLNFGLTNSATSGTASLTPSAKPQADTPAALPTEFQLKRPDGKTPPSGSGGLKPPAPPAAAKDALVSADIGSQAVPAAPASAVMGSLTGGISLANLGPVTRYGKGDAARSAPSGQKLIAFKTAGAQGNDGDSTDLTSKATVIVDGGAAQALPARTAAYYVVAVPADAKTVALTLVDSGITQSLSLLDGKPGSGNIAVLARKNRTVDVTATVPFTFTYSPEVGFADGTGGTSQTATASFTHADLSYIQADVDGGTSVTASSPSTAILFLELSYTGTKDKGEYGFPASLVTFTPSGGAAVAAKNIAGATKDFLVFEVPAGLTTGTITIGGTATLNYADATGTYKESVPTAVTMPFSLPAG
jgi:hypothetical protein